MPADVYNSLTVEFSRTPGQSFQRKVLSKSSRLQVTKDACYQLAPRLS